MPPGPPFAAETGIPGSTVAFSGSSQLYTHSSKFPIERQITLSSTEKNFKIPILNDIKKRSKTGSGSVIAPDAPPKRLTAWIQSDQMQQHQIYPSEQVHLPNPQNSDTTASLYRATYCAECPSSDLLYANNNGYGQKNTIEEIHTGVVGLNNYPHHLQQDKRDTTTTTTTTTLTVGLDQEEKSSPKNSRGVTKTYHAIKDIISGKFRAKETLEKVDETVLNNVVVSDNAKKLPENGGGLFEMDSNRISSGQVYPNNTMNDPHHHQYVLQQQQQQQQQQSSHQFYAQQLRNQQQQFSHLIQQQQQQRPPPPPPDLLKPKPEDLSSQNPLYSNNNNKTAYMSPHHFNNSGNIIENNHPQANRNTAEYQNQVHQSNAAAAFEARRSAQQIERDNLKQKNLDARRTMSNPHLLLDDQENNEIHNNGLAQQQPISVRRGSLGNILEAQNLIITPNNSKFSSKNDGKESDDGGFLNRLSSTKGKYPNHVNPELVQKDPNTGMASGHEIINKTKVIESSLQITDLKRRCDLDSGEKDRASSNIDSGRGSAAYSSGRRPALDDVDDTPRNSPKGYEDTNDQGNDSEWVDIVEKELRHILEPKLLELSLRENCHHGVNNTRSTISGGSISSITPPLPPLSGGDNNLSPTLTPKSSGKFKSSSTRERNSHYETYNNIKGKIHPRDALLYEEATNNNNAMNKYSRKNDYNNMALRGKQIFGLDSTDITSTTTRSLDLESILDGQSDSDANLSVADTRTIRKQLEGLENMYSEVLKFLGVNKRVGVRYQPSDPRIHKKRHGSMSSLPSSSVSSVRRERRYVRGGISEDRRRGREPIKGTAKRFQRLEAHVVTLARSVAHLSSEMRTQHLVVQEIESVRQEVAALRAQTNMLNIRSQSNRNNVINNVELPTLANPARVKKLTKFFGDEPPLLRLFLRKLGYEKYANSFENEKIGMVELPYLTEERLQKMGIPLGPRLRIMQEAQISVYKDNTLCIV